ncbi:MAG TPA: hypothetical protein VNT30_00575 [Stellaceae bacterium]|nr:hypothetical protein [Stellaceae bacterium]
MAPSGMQAADDRALWAETRQWLVRLAALVIGVAGLFGAAGTEDPIGYICGLGAAIAAVVFLFIDIDRYFDGAPPWRLGDFLVDSVEALIVVVVLLLVLAVAGLFLAARFPGVGYYAGLGLAVASIVAIFLNIGAYFDAAEHGGTGSTA